jgi:hypothetical protein
MIGTFEYDSMNLFAGKVVQGQALMQALDLEAFDLHDKQCDKEHEKL